MLSNAIATNVPGTVHLIDLEGDIYAQNAQVTSEPLSPALKPHKTKRCQYKAPKA
jgi:hypothetical protein